MTPLHLVILACGTILGASLGSFFNACLFRWKTGGSILNPPFSQCPMCKIQISGWRNIPLISYSLQLGRCQCKKFKIPPKYLIWEILGALIGGGLTLLLFLLFPLSSPVPH